MYSMIVDYTVFGTLMLVSLGIGIFYSRKQKTTTEYIHGNHNMGLLPVSVSLFVSFVSAMTMQGLPAEVYVHGLGVGLAMFAFWGIVLVAFTFLPIYYYLKPTSCFEYLEVRFRSRKTKVLASLLSLCSKTVYCGLVIYGPAAGLESFSGIPTSYSIIIMVVVCTVYTSLGGLRGVIWTDVFQAFVILLGFCTVIIMGINKIGISMIWKQLQNYERTTIDFRFDPTVRNSFWICLICIGFQWFVLFSLQTAMIRYTSLPTKRQATISIIIGGFGCIFLMFLASSVGAVVFAYYANKGCGPIASGQIYSSNQVVPYFVVTVLNYPGVPGLFLAAIVASTLSSVSSIQNAFTAMLWNDMLSPFLPDVTERKKTIIMKILVLAMGGISTIIAFAAKYTGETLYNLGFLVLDVLLAPAFGMFILGAGFTFTSSIGALTGCLVSSAICLWISIGKMIHGTKWTTPNLINEMCNVNMTSFSYGNSTLYYDNTTTMDSKLLHDSVTEQVSVTSSSGYLWIYNISSYANPTIGLFVCVLVGLLISIIPACRHKEEVDENLLFPITRLFLKYTGKRKSYDLTLKVNGNVLDQKEQQSLM